MRKIHREIDEENEKEKNFFKNKKNKSKKFPKTYPDFMFCHLNGMSFNHPENIYQQLLKEIAGLDCNKNQACLYLNTIFTKGVIEDKWYKKESEHLKKMGKENLSKVKVIKYHKILRGRRYII